MEKTQNKLLAISVPAGADMLTTKRFVKMSSGVLAYCTANAKALGVLELEVVSGDDASVITHGIVLVEVGVGGITENTEITSDANGKAIAVANLGATATGANVTSVATGADVSFPSGATGMTSTSAHPTFTTTQPSIANTITQPSVALAGGALPVKINGIALDTANAGEFARILLK